MKKAVQEMGHIVSPGWTDEKVKELGRRLQSYQPTFLFSNFDRSFPRKPSRIFVDSMSEIAFWKPDWMHMVLRKIRRHPEHSFLFLTKDPRVYSLYAFPYTCALGATATTELEVLQQQTILASCKNPFLSHITFLSLEPIQEEINPSLIDREAIDWLIVGAETGNRKGKVIPEHDWIHPLVFSSPVPVFMKENLQEIWQMPLIQEFPDWSNYAPGFVNEGEKKR